MNAADKNNWAEIVETILKLFNPSERLLYKMGRLVGVKKEEKGKNE